MSRSSKERFFLVSLASLFVCGLFLASCPSATADETSPHIVYLLADDLGWKDVSFHGSKIRTPHLDRLASEGTILDRFYVCPVCSPTRAGLMTGRWPIRNGLMRTVIPPWRTGGLPPEEVTIAEALAEAGYGVRGIVGKWHLGHSSLRYHPLNQGFTTFFGHYNGAIDYFDHTREGEVDWHHDFDDWNSEGYSTDLFAEAAVEIIKEARGTGKPMFLYVPFNAVHSPFQAPTEDVEANSHLAKKQRRMLGAMATALDRAVGKILAALEKEGMSENTLVWFSSDNGGLPEPRGSNRPLRGHKSDVYEGGVRVPAMVRWPGHIPAGAVLSEPVGYIDVLPTLMAASGSTAETQPLDGINLLPALLGKGDVPQRDWYHFINMGEASTEKLAVMDWPWKLVVLGGRIDDPAQQEKLKVELYRLDRDPNEKQDLATEHPERVESLRAKAEAFRKLQPEDHLPAYGAGRQGFVAPTRWRIGEE